LTNRGFEFANRRWAPPEYRGLARTLLYESSATANQRLSRKRPMPKIALSKAGGLQA